MTPVAISVTGASCHEVELSHGTVRYFESGTGEPVLLLHGAGFISGGHSWLPTIPSLAKDFRVIAPDMVGWGPGDQLATGYSFAYLADFVRELQDCLGISKAHVVGHSMGGWIASILAYESPERVARLVLVAAGGLATRQLSTMVDFTAPSPDAVRATIGRLPLDPTEIDALVAERISLAGDSQRIERFRKVMQHMSDPEARQRYQLARRLPYIGHPTLVLWGTEDAVNPLEMGQRAVELLPHAQLRTFAGAGHGLPWERVDEFNSTVLEFLGAR